MLATSTEIATYSTATEIASKFAVATDNIRRLLTELSEHIQNLNAAFAREATIGRSFDFRFGRIHNDGLSLSREGIDSLLTAYNRDAWAILVDKLGIKKLMSAKDRDKLEDQLNGGSRHTYSSAKIEPLPQITAETITSVLQGFIQSAPEFFHQQVREVYEWLVPGRWQGGYVTNQRDRVGRKVIRTYAVDQYNGKRFSVCYRARGNFDSLETVFRTLDGKGPIQGHNGELTEAIALSDDGTGETEYFRFRCFKNGNLHLEFKRLDLLEEFNRIAVDGSRIGGVREKAKSD